MALKINKQNTNFSITKGFLLLFFQFCIHLMNTRTFPRLFYLLDPHLYADPNTKHCLNLAENFKICTVLITNTATVA